MPKQTAKKHPLTFADLMKIKRLTSPSVSPDGRRVAFVTAEFDIKKNKSHRTIRILDLGTRTICELTPGPGDHHSPAWSPDGHWLAFVSNREKTQGSQLWMLPADGGEAKRVTTGYGGVAGPTWAPDSKRIAFARSIVVSPDYDEKKDKELDPAKGPEKAKVYGLVNAKSSARIADELLFRHWDAWRDRRRNHLFIIDVRTGKMTDLTPGDIDVPPFSLGAERDYDFSPDGREIAFVMNPDKVLARSTNLSIFVLPLKGIKAAGAMRCISTTEACDTHPRYTLDGSSIVYLGMRQPRYEADKNRVKVYDRPSGKTKTLLDRFDRSPHAFELADDDPNGALIFAAQDRGRISLYRLSLGNGRVMQLTMGTTNMAFRSIPGSTDLLVTRETTTTPTDFYLLTPGAGIKPHLAGGPIPKGLPADAGANAVRLTEYGNALDRVEMNEAEEFWYKAADKHPIHGFLIRPPKFNARKKYPLILLIHGGPQSAFLDSFHYRWNAQMFAASGAVVVFLNPRGSTGYGQKFTDQISRDWGGRCYDDIMRGVDYLLKKFRFVDGKRMAAAGASFGGFMVNWIAGHSNRFKSLVSHDGVFFAETMAYTTEELWFDEHEHGGFPHTNRKSYTKNSPHMFVGKFKTPTLVIHGGNDFRCPISEGIGLFTAMQVMGVPSRFVYFPDEGHWVMQPANAEVWYHEVINWMMKYIAK